MAHVRPVGAAYDFDQVAARLAEAGATLLAMRVSGLRPAGYRSSWPDILGTVIDERAMAVPTAREISRMEEALGWVGLIPEQQGKLRKLVGARALTNPRSEKPLFSWKVLGEQLGCSEVTAKTWWIEGIGIIVRALNRPGLCATLRTRQGRAVG